MPENYITVLGPAPPANQTIYRQRKLSNNLACSDYCSQALGGGQATFFFNIYVNGSDLICSCCPVCNTVRQQTRSVTYVTSAVGPNQLVSKCDAMVAP